MIPNLPSSQDFTADGAVVEFSYDFSAPDTTHVHVAIDGVEQTSGFTVSSTSEGDGYVTFDSAPVSGSTVTVWRETPMEQTQAFGTGSSFFPKQVERALDNVTMMVQEVRGGKVAGGGVPFATSAGFASSAGALTSGYKAELVASAVASVDLSGSTAAFAESAGGLTTSALEQVLSAVVGATDLTSADYASSAGVASSLTSDYKDELISSATSNIELTGGTAAYAFSAGGLTTAAKSDIVSSAAVAVTVPDAEYDGPFRVQISSGGSVIIDGPVTSSGERSTAGYVLGNFNLNAAQLVLSAHISASYGSNKCTWVYLIGHKAYGSQAYTSLCAVPSVDYLPSAFESAGFADSTGPNVIKVPLAKVFSSGSLKIVEQLQYGNIYAPQWGVQVSSGISVTSDGTYVLTEAQVGSLGGVRITHGVSSSGYSFDDSNGKAVPTASGVYNFVSGYVASNGGGGGSGGTSTVVYSGGTADYASSAGGLTTAAMTTVVSSAAAAVNITSVSEAGVASSLTSAAKADILASVGGGGGGSSTIIQNSAYGGPFAVTASGSTITVAGGRMYLGGAEYAVGSTTLTSSNGTVYYYAYYSSGSYYSGCSVAASASALASVIRGSQGYYTALANVQGGAVTQCHYGDIRIDGRVS